MLFTIGLDDIKLRNGTALKWLALDANKNIIYKDEPGGLISVKTSTKNKTYYPLFTNTSSGTIDSVLVKTDKLTFNPSSGTLMASIFKLSDKRLKQNIDPLSIYDFTKIKGIRFVKYTLKEDSSNKIHFGVIADEVEEVYPEFVDTNDKGIKSVNYTELLLLKIAELEKRIDILEKTTRKKWRAEKCVVSIP